MQIEGYLNQDILKLTMQIQEEFPELSKYLKEMPVKDTSVHSSKVDTDTLAEYHNSLEELVNKYAKTHTAHKATGVILVSHTNATLPNSGQQTVLLFKGKKNSI